MKRVMVCVDLTNESLDLLKQDIKKKSWSDVDEVHLIHGFWLQSYVDSFHYTSYPPENLYGDIEQSVIEVFKPLENKLLKSNNKIKVISKCIIASSPKESLVSYAIDKKINSMLIGTRGKHGIAGLFSSSFSEYMVRHAPCELRIIRGD